MNNSNYGHLNEDDEDIYALDLNIDAVRALHSHLEYAIQMWPGSPRRPPEEQEFLKYLKSTLFAAMLQHNFDNNEADKN